MDTPVNRQHPFFVSFDWETNKDTMYLDLSYSDNLIRESVKRWLDRLGKKVGPASSIRKKGYYLEELDWQPQLMNGEPVKVVRVPGQCPNDLDPDETALALHNDAAVALDIDFSSGKTKIKNEGA